MTQAHTAGSSSPSFPPTALCSGPVDQNPAPLRPLRSLAQPLNEQGPAAQSILEERRSRHGIDGSGWSFHPARVGGSGLYTRDASPTRRTEIKPSLAGLELTVPTGWNWSVLIAIARQLATSLPRWTQFRVAIVNALPRC